MHQKAFLPIFLACFLAATKAPASDLPPSPSNVISLSNEFGDKTNLRQLTYERRISGRNSWLIGATFGLVVDWISFGGERGTGQINYSTFGAMAAYRWWFGRRPTLMGWFVGPSIHFGVKTVQEGSDDGITGATSNYAGAALEGGYQKIFKNGFTLTVGNEINRWEGGVGTAITLGLGYAY